MGGSTTKIHLACDGRGWPLAFTLTGRSVSDCTQLEAMMARIRMQRRGPGRPRTRPRQVAADKGLLVRGCIRRGESRCCHDRDAYRRRNLVERCFNKLKHNKALA